MPFSNCALWLIDIKNATATDFAEYDDTNVYDAGYTGANGPACVMCDPGYKAYYFGAGVRKIVTCEKIKNCL